MRWFIAAIVVLTACEGPEGPMGPQGEQGIKGNTGERGRKGDSGADADVTELQAAVDSLEALVQLMQAAILPADDEGTEDDSEPPEPTPTVSGSIEGIAAIEFWGVDLRQNWDADIEDDGIILTVYPKDGDNDIIYRWDATVSIDVSFHVAADLSTTQKKYSSPYFQRTYVIRGHEETEIRIVFSEYESKIALRDRYEIIHIGPYVITVVEVTLTQVDGSQFTHRKNVGVVLPNP